MSFDRQRLTDINRFASRKTKGQVFNQRTLSNRGFNISSMSRPIGRRFDSVMASPMIKKAGLGTAMGINKGINSVGKFIVSNRGMAISGIAGGALGILGLLSAASRAHSTRTPDVRASIPRLGTAGQTLNLGVDPMSGVRFATMRRNISGFK